MSIFEWFLDIELIVIAIGCQEVDFLVFLDICTDLDTIDHEFLHLSVLGISGTY